MKENPGPDAPLGRGATDGFEAAVLSALLAGAPPALSGTTHVFDKFLAPNDALWTDVMLPWIADVEKATVGRVKFCVPAASRALPPEVPKAVQQGWPTAACRGSASCAPPTRSCNCRCCR